MGKQWKQWDNLFSWTPKLLQIVTAAMKLKDAYSLEEQLWHTGQHIKKQRHYFANKCPSSQSYGFSSSHVWTIKKPEHRRVDAFELWCWRELLRVPWSARSKHLLISWLQSQSAAILESKKINYLTVSIVSPSICQEVMRLDAMILVFWMLSFKLGFSLSSFPFIKRLFSSSLLSAIRVMSSAYLRLLILLPEILIPACTSSSLAFCMVYTAQKLNKHDDNIQPWHTPFPILNQFVVPCLVLTVASWPAYRFLRMQVRWSGIPISLRIFHSLL